MPPKTTRNRSFLAKVLAKKDNGSVVFRNLTQAQGLAEKMARPKWLKNIMKSIIYTWIASRLRPLEITGKFAANVAPSLNAKPCTVFGRHASEGL